MTHVSASNSKNITISYAQNREDIILAVLLYGIKDGFYVDVGANGPIIDSVTKYFYERGWRGINIEPSPMHIQALKSDRPEDVNLQVAVGNSAGLRNFRQYHGRHHGLSTLSSQMKSELSDNHEHSDYKVETLPLADILDKHLGKKRSIDFLKIDVEGLEYEVIESNDWERYRPKIIVIEANHVKKDWHPLLAKLDYKKVFFDGLNEYYADKSYERGINFKRYPEVALEGTPIISIQQLMRHRDTVDALKNKLDSAIAQREDQRNKLIWACEHPIRFALAKLYHHYIARDHKERQ